MKCQAEWRRASVNESPPSRKTHVPGKTNAQTRATTNWPSSINFSRSVAMAADQPRCGRKSHEWRTPLAEDDFDLVGFLFFAAIR